MPSSDIGFKGAAFQQSGEAARFEGSNPNAIEWRSAKLPCYGKKRLFRVKHGKS
tara:strand:- start:27530 stop:27691 length:162 start_codon:yes stop_codon:yes gene_type:complete